VATTLGRCDGDAEFEFALDFILDGLARLPGDGEHRVPAVRRTFVAGAAGRSCYIDSSSKISTAHFPSLPDRNGRPSVSPFAAARSSASTIV
jgi:hypothetical protein